MVQKPYRRMQLPSELEQPSLSTDLDWMLSSSQTSVELIVEAIVHEHYTSLFCLAHAYLGDRQLAGRAVQQSLVGVIEKRHRFRQSKGVNQLLFQELIASCRHLGSLSSQQPSEKSKPESQVPDPSHLKEEELWQIVKESGDPARTVLLFYYLIGLSPHEIAAILAIQEADITSTLSRFRNWIHLIVPEKITVGEDAELWVVRTLQKRWPYQSLPEEEQAQITHSVIRSLDERNYRKQLFNWVQQVISVLIVLAVLAVVAWASNRFLRASKPQKILVYITATSQPRVNLVAPTATPTEIPDRVAQRLPPLARRRAPLNEFSTPEEIRQRMYESRTLWSNVWVMAQLIRYGPNGFVGPGQVYRNLMWINNPSQDKRPERRLVIAGSTDDGTLYTSLVLGQEIYEIDLRNGLTYKYNLNKSNPFYDVMLTIYRGIYGFDQRGILDGSYLSGMIFSAGLVSLPGKMEVIGSDRLQGREALIIVNHLDNGHTEQMWLDAYTGMVLRWRGYGSYPDELLAEIIVTNVAFETEFPEDVLTSGFFQRPPVAWEDPRGIPLKSSPRCLTFQWPDEIRTQGQLDNNVQVFADGYFLGQVQMGEPWHIQCKRSANGDLVACLNPPPGVSGALYAESSLSWFNLTDLKEVHRVLPEANWISSDFAFSPDGKLLAFWACTDGVDSCGIYVLDTLTLEPKKLIDQPPAATFFAWSPDSKYLSFVETGQTIQEARNFTILKVDTGEIAETGPFFWPDMSMPDPLAHNLGIPFQPPRDEFNACAQTRAFTQQ